MIRLFMKHLLIILSLLLTSVGWSKITDYDDLVEKDGIYYEKFSDKPFTGKVIGNLIKGKIKDGKPEGEWLYYYENGQLRSKENYKDGKGDGELLRYYKNGQLTWKGNYKDGKEDGEWLEYYKSGQLKIKRNYKDGKLIETIKH